MTHTIGDRFKRYEAVTDALLVNRTPVIARFDGRAFHTLTRSCAKPFDAEFMDSMQATAIALCKEVQGCKMAYWQSDEISLLIGDYDKVDSAAWFDYRLQKMCSIGASIASVNFTRSFGRDGFFDARFFNVPENDVANYFVWRQQDAERNSLLMVAQSLYSHRELRGKKKSEIHDMLHCKNVNWSKYPIWEKRGAAVVRQSEGGWDWDRETPIFTRNRDYIESRLPG